jgi:acyl carrier protein
MDTDIPVTLAALPITCVFHGDLMVKDHIRAYLQQAHALESIADDTPLLDSGLLDSMDAMHLADFVSETYGIELGPDDLRVENFSSITAISAFIDSKKLDRLGV